MHLPDFVVLHLLRHGKTSLGTLGLVLKSQFVDGSGSLSFAEATEGSLRARAAYTAHHGPQTSWSLDFSPLYARSYLSLTPANRGEQSVDRYHQTSASLTLGKPWSTP